VPRYVLVFQPATRAEPAAVPRNEDPFRVLRPVCIAIADSVTLCVFVGNCELTCEFRELGARGWSGSRDKRGNAMKRQLAILAILAVAGCGTTTTVIERPTSNAAFDVTAVTVTGCKALVAWENSSAPVSANGPTLRAIVTKSAGTKFSSDLRTWVNGSYPQTLAESNKVNADCSAVGVPNPIGGNTSTTPAPGTPAPSTPSPAPSTPAAPSTPTMTVSQQQAVSAAQQYLASGQGFSYQGLLQQLTSSYGNGFSQSDAKFAINYVSPVNWDQQAVEAAKGYLAEGGFSQSSLLQQLTSSYGSGFTETQAEYAVTKTMG
jgi:hypothetical protein